MRLWLILILIPILGGSFLSKLEAEKRLGILPFLEKGDVFSGAGEEISLLCIHSVDQKKYIIKERMQLKPILRERLFRQEIVKENDLSVFGIDYLLLGEVQKQGSTYQASYRLVDLEGNIIVSSGVISAEDWSFLKTKLLESLVNHSLANIPKGYARLSLEFRYLDQENKPRKKPIVVLFISKKLIPVSIEPNCLLPAGYYRIMIIQEGCYPYFASWKVFPQTRVLPVVVTFLSRPWYLALGYIVFYLLLALGVLLLGFFFVRRLFFARYWEKKIRQDLDFIQKESQLRLKQEETNSVIALNKKVGLILEILESFPTIQLTRLASSRKAQQVRKALRKGSKKYRKKKDLKLLELPLEQLQLILSR